MFISQNSKQWRTLEILTLLLILILAAYLRLVNLAHNPGWYADEGTHVNIAQNLLHGRTQYLGIRESYLLFARLPLFETILAGLFSLWGAGITTLRVFTGGLGVLSVAMLYAVVRRVVHRIEVGNRHFPLLAALAFAIYPQAVTYSRFGFSYNLLTPLVLLVFLGLWEYLHSPRRRWLLLSVIAIGIGSLSDLMMLVFVPAIMIASVARRWRDLSWSLPLMALPFGLFASFMLFTVPEAFLFDIGFTLSRLGGMPLPDQLANVALNYTTLIAQDVWILGGLIGLFLLRPIRLRRLVLVLFLSPLILLGRTVALYNLSFYYMIPLLPFVGLGVAGLVDQGAARVTTTGCNGVIALYRHWRWPRLCERHIQTLAKMSGYVMTFTLVITPLLISAWLSVRGVGEGFHTGIESFLVNGQDARRVAAFVNEQGDDADVIIASPALAWLLEAHVADFQMAVAATGEATPHLPGNLPDDRFVFDPAFSGARFVIVDDLWRNWGGVHVPGVYAMMLDLQSWRLVFQAGAIEVYENPAF